jgi:hypothetical protein
MMPLRDVATGVVRDNRSLEPKNAIVLGCDIKNPPEWSSGRHCTLCAELAIVEVLL